MKADHLKERPNEALQRVSDFLGIERFSNVAPKQVHARPYQSGIDAADVAYLRARYEHGIRDLERELGIP